MGAAIAGFCLEIDEALADEFLAPFILI